MPTDPCDPVTVTATDGTRLSLRAHGGQVTGWAPAGGPERLWLSRTSRCGPGAAVRGGIPVVWPQFSDRGPLVRHGFARDRAWQVVSAAVAPDGAAGAELLLRDDAATRAIWPYGFALVLRVRAVATELALTLHVANTGADAWDFTAALHAYVAVTDLVGARLHGTGGATAEDNAHPGTPLSLPAGPSPVAGPLDLALRAVPGPVSLADAGLPRLSVTTVGWADLVVWNPGPGRAPADVHPGGEAEFVCLEPAVLTPVRLVPGASWQAGAMFTTRQG